MRKNSLIVMVLIFFICFGCNKKKEKNSPKAFDYGKVEGNTYKNNFFNFTFKYPSGWSTLDKSELNNTAKEGLDNSVKDKNLKAQIDANTINAATLFSAIKKPKGDNIQFMPSILINCENISSRGDDMTAKAYLEQSKKIMKQTNMVIDIKSEQITKIDGVTFSNMELVDKTMETAITQDYYIAVIKGFALNITLTYVTDAQKTTLQNSLKTLKFN